MPEIPVPHGENLRIGRYSQSGHVYLVTTTTYNRIPVFEDLHAGRVVVNSLRYQHENGFVNSLSFVVMPDHLHWLIQLAKCKSLDNLMRTVKSYSAWKINQYRNSHGNTIWQPGYHDHALRNEEDIAAIARYIVENPLRAGLVERLEEYSLWDTIWV